ncbi:hypothetical protein H072_7427 [Dactylellina haptotyla CBS 200.50]|uniref:Uncharacterized protein n=1 Tax=Dactylellina haptotyla (strain CBS 200.50) TaxID=1284197 RepID=S8ACL5_DACHA|nr:hypothetical protein H072_7427 [Dactylellina haptotyla CBS 200.50]
MNDTGRAIAAPKFMEDEMATRSRRPPPINTRAASSIGFPSVSSNPQQKLSNNPISKTYDMNPPKLESFDRLLENLRQEAPVEHNKARPLPQKRPMGANEYSTASVEHQDIPRSTPKQFVPRIPRHCDDLIEQLRNGENPSMRRNRGNMQNTRLRHNQYRGVHYNGPASPDTNGVPEWYLNAQSSLRTKNPLKMEITTEMALGDEEPTPPPSASLPSTSIGYEYLNRASLVLGDHLEFYDEESVTSKLDDADLPMSPISPVESSQLGNEFFMEIPAGIGRPESPTVPDFNGTTIQRDIEDNFRMSRAFKIQYHETKPINKRSSYVSRLRGSVCFDSDPIYPTQADETLVEKPEPEEPVEEAAKWDALLDYYSEVVVPYDDPIEKAQPQTRPPPVTAEAVEDQFHRDSRKADRLSVSYGPILMQVGVDDEETDRFPASRNIVEKVTERRGSNPPPVPPKRRASKLAHSVVGSHSPPHEIKTIRHKPQLVPSEASSAELPPPVPPKIPITPHKEASPELPKSKIESPQAQNKADANPSSITGIFNGLSIDDEEIFDFDKPLPKPKNKAMERLGIEPRKIPQPPIDVVLPPRSRLSKEIHRMKLREDILQNEAQKSPKGFSFSGAAKALKNATSTLLSPFANNADEGSPNPSEFSKGHRRNASHIPTVDSPRQESLRRSFTTGGESPRPSTADSIRSFGASNHESWGSGHASGDTGVTSADDGYPTTTPTSSVLDPAIEVAKGHDILESKFEPAENVDTSYQATKKGTASHFTAKQKRRPSDVTSSSEQEKKSGFFAKLRPETEEEMIARKGDKAIKILTERMLENERKEHERQEQEKARAFIERANERKEKLRESGRPGFFTEKGQFFRAKNPLELTLCDTDEEEDYYNTMLQNEQSVPVDNKKLQVPLPESTIPSNGPIPSPIAEEPEFIIPNDDITEETTDMQGPEPGNEINNEPRSYWSDDSDDESAGQVSQPPTPSHPSFPRSFRSHKRNGSGSSNLGTGPMLMRKAVRKLKGNRKSSVPSVESRGLPSPSLKRNRDSVISQISTATRESARQVASPSPAPPLPTPTIPTRTSGGVTAAPETPSKASNLPIPKITTGTYHDQSNNVVHQFGGIVQERSGSSLGHHADRNSMINTLPERCRSSLGHNLPESANINFKRASSEISKEHLKKQMLEEKAQKKKEKANDKIKKKLIKEAEKREKIKIRQDDADVKRLQEEEKSFQEEEKKNRKAELNAKKVAILTPQSYGQWV